jgi:site-specific DNA recombinase
MPFRAAIWAAVSTETQAASDKVSLGAQEELCRSLLTSRGWHEVSGPYVVPGASRTRWVNLRDAEREIPQLGLMLDDAQAARFNLLVLYDFNRLRDLLDPVSRTLAAYGTQVFSVSQPVDPLPPEEFDGYTADTSSMVQGLSQIISRAQIADLRRKYRVAMPRRVKEFGLPANGIPYGYAKPQGRETDRKAVPVQISQEIETLQLIRNLFLSGHSRADIALALTSMGIPPPRSHWNPATIGMLLTNPFYCGLVVFGRSRVKADPRSGQRKRLQGLPRSMWAIGQGKHEPLWTQDEFEEVQEEIRRRRGRNIGIRRPVYQLSSILRCAECGSTLGRFRNGPRGESDGAIWRCYLGSSHPRASISEARALSQLAGHLHALLDGVSLPALPVSVKTGSPAPSPEQLSAKRLRYQRAYGDGLMSYEDFAGRIRELDEQAELIARRANQQTSHRRHRKTVDRLAGILGALPAFLSDAPPLEVNQALRDLLEGIVVGRGMIVEVQLRAEPR